MGIRQQFLALLGSSWGELPLRAEVESVVEEGGIVTEKLWFSAGDGARIPALLLRPGTAPVASAAPAAAVLCIHQHNGEYALGKSEPAGQSGNPDLHFALDLARRGFVALCPDLEGFEERQASAEERTRWAVTSAYPPVDGDFERFIAMRHLLSGRTLQGCYLHDLARAVDYLVTRPEVDATRIGAIGHSLGGQEVVWALLNDRRLRVGVCSCGVSTWETILRDGANHNFAAHVPGLLEVGDTDALVAALAPTPFLLAAGSTDWQFPIDGVRRIAEVAHAAYAAAGAPNGFAYREFEGGHSCPDDIRRDCYEWLEFYFAPANSNIP